MVKFLPTPPSGKEYTPTESDPMSEPVCLYMSKSAFLVDFTYLNKYLLLVRIYIKT